jgi:hypothetical protein
MNKRKSASTRSGIGVHYPCSQTADVTFTSGETRNFTFSDEIYPVLNVTPGPMIPKIPSLCMSAAPTHMYEQKEVMLLDEDRVKHQLTSVPPMKVRRNNDTLKNLAPFTPKAGDTIGFVGGDEMIYKGKCVPFAKEYGLDDEILLFTVKERSFVVLSKICPIIEKTKKFNKCSRTIRRRLVQCNDYIDIMSAKNVPYDTLVLLKLLGAVEHRSPRTFLVSTKSVNIIEAEMGMSIEGGLNWKVK